MSTNSGILPLLYQIQSKVLVKGNICTSMIYAPVSSVTKIIVTSEQLPAIESLNSQLFTNLLYDDEITLTDRGHSISL